MVGRVLDTEGLGGEWIPVAPDCPEGPGTQRKAGVMGPLALGLAASCPAHSPPGSILGSGGGTWRGEGVQGIPG